jgi:hypothetical protein
MRDGFGKRAARESERCCRHRRAEDVERAHASLNPLPGAPIIAFGGNVAAIERQSRERMRRHHVQPLAIASPGVCAGTRKHEMPRVPPSSDVRANTQ